MEDDKEKKQMNIVIAMITLKIIFSVSSAYLHSSRENVIISCSEYRRQLILYLRWLYYLRCPGI